MYLSKNWWMFLVRGILAIILGMIALLSPSGAFLSVVLIIGIYALVSGVVAIISALTSNARSENWWWLIFVGILGILFGAFTLIQPAAMSAIWLLLIAAWAILTGILEIITGIRLREFISGEFWLILGGAVSVLFGIFLLVKPASGAFAIGFIIGIFAILIGIMYVFLAFSMKKFNAALSAEYE